MNCKRCGAPLENGAKVCGVCGTFVETVNMEMTNQNPVNYNTAPVGQPVQNNYNTTPTGQVMQNNYNVSSDDEQKSGKKKVILVVSLLLMIILVGGVVVKLFFNNPKNIVKGLLDASYNMVESTISSFYKNNLREESVLMEGNFSINTNYDELKDLNNMNFNYIVGADLKNEKMQFGMTLIEDNKAILDAIIYMLNNKIYLSLKDDFPGLIEIDDQSYTDITSELMTLEEAKLSRDDILYIAKAFKDYSLESLDMNEFKKSSDKITIDGKETKVSKISYKLNDKNNRNYMTKLTKKFLEDEKCLNIFANLLQVEVDELKELFNSNEYDEINTDNEDYGTINIYTKGFIKSEFVGMDIVTVDNNKVEFRVNKDNISIEIKEDNKVLGEFTIKTEDKNSYTIEFKTYVEDKDFKGTVQVSNKEKDSKLNEGNIIVTCNYDNESFTIKTNYTTKFGENIANVDTSKAKLASDLTDEDYEKIQNLISKIEKTNYYNLITAIMPTPYQDDDYYYYDDYDYDYDYDDYY